MTGAGAGCRVDTQPASTKALAPTRNVRRAILGGSELFNSDFLFRWISLLAPAGIADGVAIAG
jgi:hypothetical protein